MATEGITGDVAAVAHRCWCEAMQREGWRPGPRYDAQARTHDALRPFETLSPDDRRTAIACIRVRDLVEALADAIDYPRGPDRPFVASEMRAGLLVTMVPGQDHTAVERAPAALERGRVESWEIDKETGALLTVRVRWPGGDLSEHAPEARELARA